MGHLEHNYSNYYQNNYLAKVNTHLFPELYSETMCLMNKIL